MAVIASSIFVAELHIFPYRVAYDVVSNDPYSRSSLVIFQGFYQAISPSR
jgi:hypothetical protein